ncbi:hypothetical protein [Pseudoduganella sp. UC29_71]|uniref:CHASE3 domain-containing protein n=1 Tax=Pseudoduganella sp. UC29_71 TaxID=3350174 RepID=UPI00366C9E7F
MLARFDQLSLRLKLAFGFSAVLTMLLCVGALSLYSHGSSMRAIDAFLDNDDRISHLSLSSQASMSRARRYEKEFLLKVKVYSFQEARSRYATLVTGHLADVRADLAAMRRLRGEPGMAAALQAIEQATHQYQAGFLRVVALYGRLGNADGGLEGELTASARALEARLAQGGPERLRIGLLALRRQEKTFLLHRPPRQAADFDAAAAQLGAELAQAGLPRARARPNWRSCCSNTRRCSGNTPPWRPRSRPPCRTIWAPCTRSSRASWNCADAPSRAWTPPGAPSTCRTGA